MLVDTHCHLNFKAYKNKLEEIISRAKTNGIEKIIVPGAKLDSSKRAVEIAQKYNNVYAAVGIHPHHAKEEIVNLLNCQTIKQTLEKLAINNKVVAIGECGLDYHIYKDENINKEIQKKVFELQIDLAYKLNLPLIFHNREADDDVLEILNTKCHMLNTFNAVLHCFMGNFNLLNWTLTHHFYIGITGLVTFNKHVQEVVKKTPLNKLLIETDSPFLTPEPLRSERIFPNRPENVKIVAQWIAKIKGDSFLNVTRVTTKNATQLFKLD